MILYCIKLSSKSTLYYKENNWSFSGFEKTIKKYKIKWVLIFPLPGTWQEDLFNRIEEEMDPSGYKFSAGYLLNIGDNEPSSEDYETKK